MTCRVSYYKLDTPIIPARVYVVTGRNMLERFADRLRLHGHPGIDAMLSHPSVNGFGGMMVELGNLTYAILLPDEYVPGTVYHECLHAATRMWYDIGARLTEDNDEVIAYTMNYLASFIEDNCYGSSQ